MKEFRREGHCSSDSYDISPLLMTETLWVHLLSQNIYGYSIHGIMAYGLRDERHFQHWGVETAEY